MDLYFPTPIMWIMPIKTATNFLDGVKQYHSASLDNSIFHQVLSSGQMIFCPSLTPCLVENLHVDLTLDEYSLESFNQSKGKTMIKHNETLFLSPICYNQFTEKHL